jgi:hypothetical protein
MWLRRSVEFAETTWYSSMGRANSRLCFSWNWFRVGKCFHVDRTAWICQPDQDRFLQRPARELFLIAGHVGHSDSCVMFGALVQDNPRLVAVRVGTLTGGHEFVSN